MERAALAIIALAALALRAWNLDQNGWGAEYYSAAVRSMASGWHNFLYCAFDPAGFISVDKPPVALWVQVASVKLFGFHPLALLLPQALEGVACVVIAYVVARPRFGAAAALLAALFLALTPVMVAVNRANNVDSALVLVLLLAAWALLDAADSGRRSRWLLAMALVGIAFNTKMLAGLIVVPAFVATYLAMAPLGLRRRVIDATLGAGVLVLVSFVWVAAVELTPADSRPYVGSSAASNSMLDLVVGHNALSRFALPEGSRPRTSAAPAADPDPDEARAGAVVQRLFVRAPTGVLRLLQGQLAAQVFWWLPLAVFGVIAFGAALRRPSPAARSVFFWSAWIATYVLVLDFAGGIVHYYYVAPVAPAVAVLAAAGLVRMWDAFASGASRWLLPASIAVTAAWQLFVQASAMGWSAATLASRGGWEAGLHAAALGAAVAAVALAFLRSRDPFAAATARIITGVAVVVLLALPVAWSLSSVIRPGQGVLPSADLYRIEPAVLASDDPRVRATFGRSVDTAPLVAFLRARRGSEAFLLATTTTRIAAPVIVTTGESVMAMGGFHGLDRAITPEALEHSVAAGRVRFVMLNDAALPSRRLGAEEALAPLSDWVQAHGQRVPGAQWRSPSMPRGIALYDLHREDPAAH